MQCRVYMYFYRILAIWLFFCMIQESVGSNGCDKGNAFGWTEWSACTVTCSGGTRSRSCACVPAEESTPTCTVGDNEIETCNEDSCPSSDSNDGVIAAALLLLAILSKWFPYYFG